MFFLQFLTLVGLRRENPQVQDGKRLSSVLGRKRSQRAAPQWALHSSSPTKGALRRASSTCCSTTDVHGDSRGQHCEHCFLLDKALSCCNSQEDCEGQYTWLSGQEELFLEWKGVSSLYLSQVTKELRVMENTAKRKDAGLKKKTKKTKAKQTKKANSTSGLPSFSIYCSHSLFI